ncbi:hypothetical protein [Rhodohalobacter sp.]|uniref:hypothetical protein n=1 Tax=Rhodohalobacter sp. TaxID=1974210 RepID=UPI003976B08A
MDSIKDILLGLKNEPGILSFGEYYDELAKPNRFDPADVIFIGPRGGLKPCTFSAEL